MSRIFINYRRIDTEGHVGRIYDHLVQHFDAKDIFADIESIKPGQDFLTVIENAVAGCDVFLVIIGAQWGGIADDQGRRCLDGVGRDDRARLYGGRCFWVFPRSRFLGGSSARRCL